MFRNLPLLHDYQFNYIKVHYCSLPTRDTVCMSSRETELSSHLPLCSSSRSRPLLLRAPEEPENRRQFWRPSCYKELQRSRPRKTHSQPCHARSGTAQGRWHELCPVIGLGFQNSLSGFLSFVSYFHLYLPLHYLLSLGM